MRRGGCTERRLRRKVTGQKRGFGPAFLSKQFHASCACRSCLPRAAERCRISGVRRIKRRAAGLPRACPKVYFDWRTRGCSGGAEADRGASISAHLNDSRQSDRHIGQHIVRGVNSSKYRSRPADDIRRRIIEGAVERLDQRGIAGADHRRVCGEKLLRPHLAIAVVEQAHEK